VVAGELERYARSQLAKATLPKLLSDRAALFADVAPGFARDLREYFTALLSRAGVRKDVAFPLDPDGIDWVAEADELEQVLRRWYVPLGEGAFAATGAQLGVELTFDLDAASTARVRSRLGNQVTGINDVTRQILRDKVDTAIERGYSIDELVDGVDDFTGLDELFGSRADTIALTETATAYNTASIAGYEDSGLVETVEVFDGPECGWTEHDDEDLADGSIRTLDEADDYPVSHPNCQRAFGPVVAE
jgi:hypothetical protein